MACISTPLLVDRSYTPAGRNASQAAVGLSGVLSFISWALKDPPASHWGLNLSLAQCPVLALHSSTFSRKGKPEERLRACSSNVLFCFCFLIYISTHVSCTDRAHEEQHWVKKHITKINTVILKGIVKHLKILFASTMKTKQINLME